MLDNLILKTDSYKLTHFEQYPENTTGVFSYFESREGAQWPVTQFFGLQYLLKRYLVGSVVTQEMVDEAEKVVTAHLGSADRFNRAGWERIVNEHGGRLPLLIKAVPEGTVVPVSNVLMTVENTDPECYWLTNYMETLLTHVWYSSTVATLSYTTKQMIRGFLERTSDSLDGLPFKLHDFGYRGATSDEAAAIGGAGHLVNFSGTDTVAAMSLAYDYYGADLNTLAFSVPATEHSIMTAEGRNGEHKVLDRLIQTYPTGILSVVSDSYNIYDFVRAVNDRRDAILLRDGVLVVRPDSTTSKHELPELLTAWIVEALWDGFGGEVNSKGYKVLDPHVRVIWGDGISPDGIEKILQVLSARKFSADNMVFGMGGGLLQKVNRDTQRFAFKSSAQRIGKSLWQIVRKEPLDSTKASKGGRLQLVSVNGEYRTVDEDLRLLDSVHLDAQDHLLVPVFKDGKLLVEYTFDQIRENASA